MYKVIFLDDEAMTLRLLECAIDWQKHGVAICGAASDGEQGIELFRQVEPDIVITDIRMPRMNGIELAGAIRQTGKKVKILLLSAYAEFEYAHSAITYDISEYLLKPLDENKLDAAIARIVQELDREQAVSSTIENYRLEQAEKQLHQLLAGNRSNASWDIRALLPPEMTAACGAADTLIYCLCVAEPHTLAFQPDSEAIRLLLKERLGAPTVAVAISPVEIVVLAASLKAGQLEAVLDTLRGHSLPIRAGAGHMARLSDLPDAYRQAAAALNVCFYTGKEWCDDPGEQNFATDTVSSLADFAPAIAMLVEQGQAGDLIERLQSRLAELLQRRVEPLLIFNFVFDVLNWVKFELTRQYHTSVCACLETISRERLLACAGGQSLSAYLDQLLRAIGAAVSSVLAEDSGYFIVRQAKEYTRQHYSEVEFSLQDVAAHVGMSKNHFSQIFHKLTGQKYWDYVTQLRIEKAKKLLKQSNCSNYEICRAIGYESEFYFSKIFKREVGMAAQQYRKL